MSYVGDAFLGAVRIFTHVRLVLAQLYDACGYLHLQSSFYRILTHMYRYIARSLTLWPVGRGSALCAAKQNAKKGKRKKENRKPRGQTP